MGGVVWEFAFAKMRAGESLGAAKSYCRETLRGRARGLYAGGAGRCRAFGARTGGRKVTFKETASGGRGGTRKSSPKEIAMEEGGGDGGGEGMKNHFRNLALPPESRTGCKNRPL